MTQVRDLNPEPDLLGLRDFLQNLEKGRYEIDTLVFDWINHEKVGTELRYHEFLQDHGFRVIINKAGTNLDIEVTIEALEIFNGTKPNIPNVFVLVSGNRNFAPLCQNLRKKGIRVEVASLPSFLAKELKISAHKIIDFSEWAAQKAGEPIGQGQDPESKKSKAEKEESKTKETDWENLEKKFPGIIDSLIGSGLEAEKLYFAVREVGLSEEGDMEEKWKTAVLDRFGDGSGFRYINKELLEDRGLYQFAVSQEKRDFIGNLLRKMVLLKFPIKEKTTGQQLSARILYKKYTELKQQANCP